MPWEKVPAFLKSHPCRKKNLRTTASVFLPTLQLTALLLKSFRLRLHCYTIAYPRVSEFDISFPRLLRPLTCSFRPEHVFFCTISSRELLLLHNQHRVARKRAALANGINFFMRSRLDVHLCAFWHIRMIYLSRINTPRIHIV